MKEERIGQGVGEVEGGVCSGKCRRAGSYSAGICHYCRHPWCCTVLYFELDLCWLLS